MTGEVIRSLEVHTAKDVDVDVAAHVGHVAH